MFNISKHIIKVTGPLSGPSNMQLGNAYLLLRYNLLQQKYYVNHLYPILLINSNVTVLTHFDLTFGSSQ